MPVINVDDRLTEEDIFAGIKITPEQDKEFERQAYKEFSYDWGHSSVGRFGGQLFDYRRDQDSICNLLEGRNWYYRFYDQGGRMALRKRVFGALADTAVDALKDMAVEALRKKGHRVERDDIVSVMLHGSWCYADSLAPSDLDVAVVVKGDLPRVIMSDERIVDTDKVFKDRPVKKSDIIAIGQNQLTANPLDKSVEAVNFETLCGQYYIYGVDCGSRLAHAIEAMKVI